MTLHLPRVGELSMIAVLNWNTKPMVSKAPRRRFILDLSGNSESFNWCFMGSTALCAVLQHHCNIPLRTDLDSISGLQLFLAFDSISLWLFQPLTSALVWIYVWPENCSLVLRCKTFMEWLWKSLLFCLLFPYTQWNRNILAGTQIWKVDAFGINTTTVRTYFYLVTQYLFM